MEKEQQQPVELNRQQRLEVEEKAIDALLQMGVKFSVPLKIYPVKYNRENETYNFLKRNVQFSLFFHPIKAKAFNHHLSGN